MADGGSKLTVKELKKALQSVLDRGKNRPVYIMISGHRYLVHVIEVPHEVYLVPRRDKPVPFEPMKPIIPKARAYAEHRVAARVRESV
jgi:hypothetical protein